MKVSFVKSITLKLIKLLKRGLFYLFILFLIAFLVNIIKSAIFDIYVVESKSMEPTLHSDEYVFVTLYSYNINTPEYLPLINIKIPVISFDGLENAKRGDIVIFKPPRFMYGKKETSNMNLVKRISGLPGGIVEVENRSIEEQNTNIYDEIRELNKIHLRIPKKGDTIFAINMNHQFLKDLILGEEHTFEKKNNSILIDGKPSLFYVVEKDYYFMRGDNEKFSSDSRQWGFLPKERLIGKVIY